MDNYIISLITSVLFVSHLTVWDRADMLTEMMCTKVLLEEPRWYLYCDSGV